MTGGSNGCLGFVETDTENEQVLTVQSGPWNERGLDVSQGLLVIVDGGKGLRAAGRKALSAVRALVQRCQVAKRENVVSYLAKREQAGVAAACQRAYNRPEYDEALAALQSLQHELEDRNQSACRQSGQKAVTEPVCVVSDGGHRPGTGSVADPAGRVVKTATPCTSPVAHGRGFPGWS